MNIIRNISALASKVDTTIASKSTGEIKNDMHLESGTITLLQEWLYSCSALRNFSLAGLFAGFRSLSFEGRGFRSGGLSGGGGGEVQPEKGKAGGRMKLRGHHLPGRGDAGRGGD